MDNFSDYCIVDDTTDEVLKDKSEAVADHNGITEQEYTTRAEGEGTGRGKTGRIVRPLPFSPCRKSTNDAI